jgi:hypothetical protein
MEIPEVIREKASQMKESELEGYLRKVLTLVAAMKPGDILVIEKLTKPETRELFIECVKFYMREHEWQDGLSFTKGFVSVQKYDITYTKRRRGGFFSVGNNNVIM